MAGASPAPPRCRLDDRDAALVRRTLEDATAAYAAMGKPLPFDDVIVNPAPTAGSARSLRVFIVKDAAKEGTTKDGCVKSSLQGDDLLDTWSVRGGCVVTATDALELREVMNSEPQLRETLRLLYEKTAPKGNAALANRFMYGTDWEMTLTEGHIDAYLSRFVELMRELESSPAIRSARIQDLAGKFFGNNAADWIGLRRGGRARVRLDAFYAANAVPTPDWMTKLDQSGA